MAEKNKTDKHKDKSHRADHLKPYWWKKGQPSPNPKGRPPDPFTMSYHNKNRLGEIVPARVMDRLGQLVFGDGAEIPKDWKKQKMTWAEAISLRNCFRAMTPDGDNIIKLMWEMADGKAIARIAGVEGGPPIQIEEAGDLDRLSIEELKELRRLKAKILGQDE
jgi:hypothetical protein